ncbi:MAG: cation:proton antiporter [Bacteroidales bacterium]|nr:cation:proton antiporter [Bacteroidales bacterium]
MTTLATISFHFEFWPLLVILALAWIVPMGSSLLKLQKIPSVVLEIILGYIVGRHLLTNADDTSMQILDFLALTGFIFIMFLSGLEINMDDIRDSFPRNIKGLRNFVHNPLLMATLYFIICLVISYAGSELLAGMAGIDNTWYFALIMVTTSVGIILPVLKNRGETKSSFGQMIITSAAVSDIFSIILFTFTAYILKHSFKPEILLILVLFALLYLMYNLGHRLRHIPVLKKISFQLSHAASQLSIRGTSLLVFTFVVISQFISTEVVLLGAFLSGILLSSFLHKERSLLMVKLDGMGYGFFIPIFFIMVGVRFDPLALTEFESSLLPLLLAILTLMFAIKIIPSLIWAKSYGLKRSLSGGFLLSSRLSLIIAAAAVGLELGVISTGINALFIIMAIISCLISPMIYNLINKDVKAPSSRTIIVGGSSKGVLLSRRLTLHEKQSVIIENDNKRYRDLVSKGMKSVRGDGLDPLTYKNLSLSSENSVFVDTGSDENNIRICKMLKEELLHDRIISVAHHLDVENKLNALGIDTVDTRRVLSTEIENLIIRPITYNSLIDSFEHFTLEEISITRNEIDGRAVKNIAFHKDAILILVKRGNNIFIPKGDSHLRLGDTVNILGTGTALEMAREIFTGNKFS